MQPTVTPATPVFTGNDTDSAPGVITPGMALPLPDDVAANAARERLGSVDIGVSAPTVAALGMLGEAVVFVAGVQGSAYPRPLLSTRVVLLTGSHAGGVVAGPAPDPRHAVPLQHLAVNAGAGVVTLEWQPAAAAIELEDAITPDQMDTALRAGWAEAERAADEGIELLVLAAGGAGAAAAATAVIAASTGSEPTALLGRVVTPAGLYDDNAWMTRCLALRDALYRVRDRDGDPRTVLAALGGADIAAGTGLVLGAASRRTPVMIDGPVGAAAAMLANDFAAQARRWVMLPDTGRHPAVRLAAEALQLRPWLDLCLDLGEGAASLAALPMLQTALTLAGVGEAAEPGPLTHFDSSGNQVFVGVARPVEPGPAEQSPAEQSPAEQSPAEQSPAEQSPAGTGRPATDGDPRGDGSQPAGDGAHDTHDTKASGRPPGSGDAAEGRPNATGPRRKVPTERQPDQAPRPQSTQPHGVDASRKPVSGSDTTARDPTSKDTAGKGTAGRDTAGKDTTTKDATGKDTAAASPGKSSGAGVAAASSMPAGPSPTAKGATIREPKGDTRTETPVTLGRTTGRTTGKGAAKSARSGPPKPAETSPTGPSSTGISPSNSSPSNTSSAAPSVGPAPGDKTAKGGTTGDASAPQGRARDGKATKGVPDADTPEGKPDVTASTGAAAGGPPRDTPGAAAPTPPAGASLDEAGSHAGSDDVHTDVHTGAPNGGPPERADPVNAGSAGPATSPRPRKRH